MCGMAFLLQVFLVCMLIFAAIPLTMAIIPSFAPTAGNFFKKLIGLVLHKAALMLVISVSLGITTIIYNATNLSSGLAGYMLMAFVVALINWGVFKYRLDILTLVTLGAIDRSDAAHRVIQNAGGSIQNTVSKGKEFITKRIKGSSARDSYSDENDSEQSSKPPRFYVVSGGKQNRSDHRSESGGGAGNQKVVNGGRQNYSESRGEGEKSQYTISNWKKKSSYSRNEIQTQNQEQKSNAVRSTSKNGIEQNQAKEQLISVNETQNQIQRSTSREQNQAKDPIPASENKRESPSRVETQNQVQRSTSREQNQTQHPIANENQKRNQMNSPERKTATNEPNYSKTSNETQNQIKRSTSRIEPSNEIQHQGPSSPARSKTTTNNCT